MAVINPFANDPVKGGVWEQGYLSGFNKPVDPQQPPLTPELLDVFQSGWEAGSSDKLTQDMGEMKWLRDLKEFAFERVLIRVLAALVRVNTIVASIIFHIAQMKGDSPIPPDIEPTPMSADLAVPPDRQGDVYIPICTRTDHLVDFQSVTPEGHWFGQPTDFLTAARACREHGHGEAIVVLCSTVDGSCGPVWPVVPR